MFDTPDDTILNIMNVANIPPLPKKEEKKVKNFYNNHELLNQHLIDLYKDDIDEQRDLIRELRIQVNANPDPDLISALAAQEKSFADKLKQYSEIIMQKERIESTEKIKDKEMDLKERLAQNKNNSEVEIKNNSISIRTNFEDIMKMIDQKIKEPKQISGKEIIDV